MYDLTQVECQFCLPHSQVALIIEIQELTDNEAENDDDVQYVLKTGGLDDEVKAEIRRGFLALCQYVRAKLKKGLLGSRAIFNSK